MLQAYRTLEIPVDLDGKQITVEIPFTIGLVEEVQKTSEKALSRSSWYSLKKTHLVDAFREFCVKYLPEEFDHSRAQPPFYALFFSSVRNTINDSFEQCTKAMLSTDESIEHTEGNQTAESE